MADLEGFLVVALEQAVAAPYTSNLLAEAGARVIKVEQVLGERLAAFSQLQLAERLGAAGIAFGRLNELDEVLRHPQLQTVTVDSPSGELALVPHGARIVGRGAPSLPVPALGQHSVALRREFDAGS